MDKKTRGLQVLAFIFMGLGIVFFLLPFIFSDVHLNLSFKLADLPSLSFLGSYLSGTAGIFITLSSVIYIYISLRLSIETIKDQQDEQKAEQRRQALRDFETLFFNLCNGLTTIKENNPLGLDTLNKILANVITRFPSERDDIIERDAASGDLGKQLVEEKILESCDSFILYVSQVVSLIDSRLSEEDNSLKSFYYQQLSYRLSKEELRVLELVKMTTLFNRSILEPLEKLSYRNYNLPEEISKRKQIEIQQQDKDWKQVGAALSKRRNRY